MYYFVNKNSLKTGEGFFENEHPEYCFYQDFLRKRNEKTVDKTALYMLKLETAGCLPAMKQFAVDFHIFAFSG